MKEDKILHFSVSFLIALFIKELTGSQYVSFSTSLLIGILKEIYDLKIKKTKVSKGDLLADFLGCAIGITI